MIENIIRNKRDTVIYKNDDILGGVFDFNIKINSSGDGLYEILQENPWQIINNSISYVITIKQYTDELISLNQEKFSLEFLSLDKNVTFEGCKIITGETYSDEKGNLVTVSVISAERMC